MHNQHLGRRCQVHDNFGVQLAVDEDEEIEINDDAEEIRGIPMGNSSRGACTSCGLRSPCNAADTALDLQLRSNLRTASLQTSFMSLQGMAVRRPPHQGLRPQQDGLRSHSPGPASKACL